MSIEHKCKHVVLLHRCSYYSATVAVVKSCCPAWRNVKGCLRKILPTRLPLTNTNALQFQSLWFQLFGRHFGRQSGFCGNSIMFLDWRNSMEVFSIIVSMTSGITLGEDNCNCEIATRVVRET